MTCIFQLTKKPCLQRTNWTLLLLCILLKGAFSLRALTRVTPRNARHAPYRASTQNYAKVPLTRVLGCIQIRLRWRAGKRKYKMFDSEPVLMLIGLYVILNKKRRTSRIRIQWIHDFRTLAAMYLW